MKVLLGMSGGVDSTCAALKLKEMGHDVVGAVLLMHDNTEIECAKESAASVGIPLKIVDCRERFKRKVIDSFANEYLSGRTPNPCVVCNSEVKFGLLYEIAKEEGFDRIATGHYAKIINKNGRYSVLKGVDARKDQSYVLWRLSQEILSVLMFPLGDIQKEDVKRVAKEKKLSAADRGESQEICFVPDNDYASYIERNYKSSEPGNFVDADGNILGRHKGIIHYTVGQRKGLGISAGERIFVSRINPNENTVVLSKQGELGHGKFELSSIVFSGLAPVTDGTVELDVKVRYLAPPTKARVSFKHGRCFVELSEKKVVTPGQSAVFYDENSVMFGGFIE